MLQHNKGGTLDTEYRTIGINDGKERWIAARGQVLYNERGEPVRFIGATLDTTERKINEESLKLALGDLERSNRELEQFAYVASHDLQEPLRMVASFVQLLAKKYQGHLDEKADEYITYAVDGAVRMQKLIDGLLAYSRISRGAPFHFVNTNDVFSEAVANLAATIRENDAEVTRDFLPVVLGDDIQLLQLFQNLLSNALKYRRRDKAPTVHVSAHREGFEWIFSFRDNGIGIEQQYFDRIFLIFQRLHTRSEYPGTGIGLALCKRIIERHDGRMWVESAPGEGSTFFFALPMREGRVKGRGKREEDPF
jgi:light-regulated signal transduction histidine kinase (bacteriophytochrome)